MPIAILETVPPVVDHQKAFLAIALKCWLLRRLERKAMIVSLLILPLRFVVIMEQRYCYFLRSL